MPSSRAAAVLLAVVLASAWCHAALASSADAGGVRNEVKIDLSASPAANAAPDAAPATGTDAGAPARARAHRAGAQEFKFEAEVSRLMDIIIHSLYSNKDIFLRELISNASDALDKIRFLSLTDKSVLGDGDAAKLEIRIWLDPAKRILYIRDRGIGMTREELVKNLGTIARSGTSAFLEQVQKGGDMSLIGQFGVGFYSVYLVADWVEVVTKANGDDKQWIWASDASGGFSISEDTGENAPLGRGTLIKIHLKDEAAEYADEAKLKALVARYSEFINFPIYMETEKEVDVPVEEEEGEEDKKDAAADADKKEDESESGDDDSDDGVEDDDDEEDDDAKKGDADGKKAPKTRKEKVKEWEVLNDVKAIWLRSPNDVSEEEYQKFYKSLSKDYDDALGWVHFKAEGDVEFKAVLFVPKRAPYGFFDRFYDKKADAVKLYVRRVFISDDVEGGLLPKWLSFIKGLVDSDTLPLNVSREMLQAHSSLKTIRKKLVRKVLDYLKKITDEEAACKAKQKDGKDGDKKDDKEPAECSRYSTFWREFGKAVKLGVVEDATNRARLAKLLRFTTSKSPETPTSLDEYVSRMPKGQKQIFWVSAASQEEAARSPFLERLVKKGYEVVYMTDVLDEYVMAQLTEYDDLKLANASKEDLNLDSEDDAKAAKEAAKALKEEFAPLTKWWKAKLEGKVAGVKVSSRLATTPCVVVASKFGQTANMERIMRAQALGDAAGNPMGAYSRSQRTLEINPRHPLIRGLLERVSADDADAAAAESAGLLFEAALLESGYALDDAKGFAGRVYRLVQGELGLDRDAAAPADDETDGSAAGSAKGGSKGGKGAGKEEDDDEEAEDADAPKAEL